MGNYLKSIRVRYGMNQCDVAKILKVSTPAYSKKENGKTDFSLSELKILKKVFLLDDVEFCNIFFSEN